MILRYLCLLVAAAWLAAAHSKARNPLEFLGVVEDAYIHTKSHRVNALSKFDLHFNLYNRHRRIKLSLEPNHDVLAEGLTITYLKEDGTVDRTESEDRLANKIYKGVTWQETDDGTWTRVGKARVTITRDGEKPLFYGVFDVERDHHHIKLRSHYIQGKHELDPDVEPRDDEFMVVWRDSDISPSDMHTDLKRRSDSVMCYANTLSFNNDPEHPVFRRMLKRTESHWGAMPIGAMFGKRQIDTQPGGNSAGIDLASSIGSTVGCPTTRKVALVGIATDCGFTAAFDGNNTDLRTYVYQAMSAASQPWEDQLDISLGLQALTILPRTCPGTPQSVTPWNQNCQSGLTITDRLNLFSAWRGAQDDNNSHWTLLTACADNTAVGLAWLGQSCVKGSTSSSSGGDNETVAGANVVAKTDTEWQVIAHETGHTFGAVHDCDSSTCAMPNYVQSQQCCPFTANSCDANGQFIMNPSSSPSSIHFSPCTVGNICSAIGRNAIDTTCLSANKGVVTITGQQCGNGIVEGDEECDCGGASGCAGNSCCDGNTCRFSGNAVCDDSNEDCCTNCQFSSADTVCRNSTGVCDPAEKCSGNGPICPADITAPNGQDCTTDDGQSAQCASGQCTSRDLQCRTIMSSYIQGGNDTYACDSQTCMVSCASPNFGPGTCYGAQQNFLDGTPCGGGGNCKNGQCEGSTVGGEIKSWIDDHKPLVIGIASAVGALLLFAILSCVYRCFRDRKRRGRQPKNVGPSPGGSWYGPPPPVPMHGPPPEMGARGFAAQPSELQLQQQAWERAQQQSWEQGWRPPQARSNSDGASGTVSPWQRGADTGAAPASPVSPIASPHRAPASPLYGNGIIGNFNRPPPPPPPPMPPHHVFMSGGRGSVRYA